MANKSGWKDSERKAAKLFPGGKRRTRVGGGTYAEVADDVIWGPEYQTNQNVMVKVPIMVKDPKTGKKKRSGKFTKRKMVQPRVIKMTLTREVGAKYGYPPVYIEVKKRTRVSEAIKMLRDAERKYITGAGKVVLIQHAKGSPDQFVTVRDEFFAELILATFDIRRHRLRTAKQ